MLFKNFFAYFYPKQKPSVRSSVDIDVTIDPSTLNEIGFIFIAFSVASTIGGFLTLIQLLGLFKMIFQYLLRTVRRRHAVYPIALSNLPLTPQSIDNAEDKPQSKTTNRDEIESYNALSEEVANFPLETKRLFETVQSIYTDISVQSIMEPQFLEDLKTREVAKNLKHSKIIAANSHDKAKINRGLSSSTRINLCNPE